MKNLKILALLISVFLLFGCGPAANTVNTNENKTTPTVAPDSLQTITIAERPASVKDMMAKRGEQDQAKPTLKIIEPKADSTVGSSTVKIKLELAGDLKGYKPGQDPATHMGNHIHVILDNQPYEAYYDLDREFELRNVADGEHTLRVFPRGRGMKAIRTTARFRW